MKIKKLKEIIEITKRERSKGKKIVMTNGCFDILHPGHIASLEWAKKRGNVLIVAINSDKSVREIKPGRPINRARDRAEVLSGLGCIDYVFIFDELTPETSLLKIKPDVYVKGKDVKKYKTFAKEKKLVEKYGGKVLLSPMVRGYSTTKIINSILGKNR